MLRSLFKRLGRFLPMLVLVPGLILLVLPAEAAITRATQSADRCSGTSCSVNHTVSTTGLEMIITVHVYGYSAQPQVTALTVGGSPATFIDRVSQSVCAAGGRCGVELWRFTNPPVGTQVISSTVTGGISITNQIVGVITYAGVDATTPIGTPAKTTGNADTQSVTVTTAAGDMVAGGIMLAAAGGSPTVSGGAVSAYSLMDLDGFTIGAGSDMAASGTTTNYGWAYGSAQPFAVLAVPLKAAGGGGGGGGLSSERLVWTDLSSGQRQETNTRVYWKHTSQPTYQLIATLSPDSVTHTVTYTTETNRCYVVDQINSAGISPVSNELCSTITAPGPIRPTLTPATLAGGLSDY